MKKSLFWPLAVIGAALLLFMYFRAAPEHRNGDLSNGIQDQTMGSDSNQGGAVSENMPELKLEPAGPKIGPDPEQAEAPTSPPPNSTSIGNGSGKLEMEEVPPVQPIDGKVAYLTFDDGPSRSTPRILQILNQYGIKATFFVIGKTSDDSKRLLNNIVDQGHKLGNHTFSHDYKQIYKSVGAFKADMDRLNRFLEETVGVKPDILRYPGGSNNQLSWRTGGRNVMKDIAREMSNIGYQHFDWNVSSTDAAAPVQEKQAIIDSVKGNSEGKKQIIVLMHDMDKKTTTVEALPAVISYLKSQGYRFDVLRKDSFTYQFLKP